MPFHTMALLRLGGLVKRAPVKGTTTLRQEELSRWLRKDMYIQTFRRLGIAKASHSEPIPDRTPPKECHDDRKSNRKLSQDHTLINAKTGWAGCETTKMQTTCIGGADFREPAGKPSLSEVGAEIPGKRPAVLAPSPGVRKLQDQTRRGERERGKNGTRVVRPRKAARERETERDRRNK